jgi:hypothetical protein
MKLVADVKRGAKRFYHKHPKLTIYGGIGAGVALFSTIVYAATRPAKKNNIANLLAQSSQAIPYARTIKGMIELDALVKRLSAMSEVLANGTPIFVDAAVFQNIWTHGGVRVLDLIPSMFYKNNQFSTDELANHAHCQTWNAQVVQLGSDWLYPFYHTVYRANEIIKTCGVDLDCSPQDKGKQVHYAGNAIDPQANPGAFNEAVHAAIEASILNAMKNGNFGQALGDLKKFGVNLPFALPGDISSLYMMAIPPGTREVLARFGRDLAAKQNKTLPTTDADGKPIPEKFKTLLHASIGAAMVGGLINMFESHDVKVNPCIKEVDAGLVFEMFMATIGTVFSLAFGPALSGISVAIKFVTTVNKLAELSQ